LRHRAGLWLAIVALSLACGGRSPAPRSARPPPGSASAEVVHVMQPGETLYRLSQRYGVSVDAIVRANGIRDVSDVPVGARIRIPGTRAPTPRGGHASVPPGGGDLRGRAWQEASLEFAWPLTGRFSSGFGRRGWSSHDGIDIAARRGTPVRAAEAGRVTHSGWLGDYGRVVIVKHAGSYSTVYAHNRANKVSKGAFVEKGDLLAEVGASGNASGPHLHFEIRRERRAENPLRYLPGTVPAAAAAGR
jgi:murein DD-endopeptidase MepM/ murein hydrolase activator NlpD